MTSGYREFEFDLPSALLDHLVELFDGMEGAPLDLTHVDGIPEAQGVYQLLLDGRLIYIGKTDAEAGLLRRLQRHSRRILFRKNLSPSRVSFKAIRVFVFAAVDLETQLIKRYRVDRDDLWNGSGFGANDPGRKRDHSKPNRFDTEFPIDLDRVLEQPPPKQATAAVVLGNLKSQVPFLLRFATTSGGRKAHPDLASTEVTISEDAVTPRSIVKEVVGQLPHGWQATALAAGLILYPEVEDKYPDAEVLARS